MRIETVGKGGGLHLSPTHVIAPDFPYENLFAFVRTAKKCGRYAWIRFPFRAGQRTGAGRTLPCATRALRRTFSPGNVETASCAPLPPAAWRRLCLFSASAPIMTTSVIDGETRRVLRRATMCAVLPDRRSRGTAADPDDGGDCGVSPIP